MPAPGDRIVGVVPGVVVNVDDPLSQGRVQVSFPTIADGLAQWARVATLMAGADRGSWFMPEPGDEALVAFERGDINFPYVVGFLWNGQDPPPAGDIDRHVRRLKTVSGHDLEFDDRPGKERILLKTQGGHQVEMNDNPDERILIQTRDGHRIEMSDKDGFIHIDTKQGQQVHLEDKNPGVKVSAPAGRLSVNSMGANQTSTSPVTITAPLVTVNCAMVVFTGVVQASTFVATSAVISPAYTPGAGNLFGL